MNEEERRRRLPLCSYHPDLVAWQRKGIRAKPKPRLPNSRMMKVYVDPNPPDLTERPWVDDPRFGLS